MSNPIIFGRTFYSYFQLLSAMYYAGTQVKEDRTKVGRISSYGCHLNLDLSNGAVPVEPTRMIKPSLSIGEMLWFLSGSTNIRDLKTFGGGSFWDNWSPSEFNVDPEAKQWVKDNPDCCYVDDIGRMYGATLRGKWSYKDNTANTNHYVRKYDQFAKVLMDLMHNPNSARIIMTTWYPSLIPSSETTKPWQNVIKGEAALAPCHGTVIQFFVTDDQPGLPRNLSMQMYQRSADIPVGLVHNITQYGFLLHLVAALVGMKPHRLMISLGDAHVYANQMDKVGEQVKRPGAELQKYPYTAGLHNAFNLLRGDLVEQFGDTEEYLALANTGHISRECRYLDRVSGIIDRHIHPGSGITGSNALQIAGYEPLGAISYPVAV